jgi:RNA polymerase sigma-70 factor (ECF subfamily)
MELMENVRDGDIRQLARLFERHHVRLYNFYLRLTGRRDVSEDLVQDVFYRMLKYRQTYTPEGDFTAWMYQLARNVHRDRHRKWRHEQSPTNETGEPASADPSPPEQLEHQEHKELLQKALSRLHADKKEILILSRYQELPYETIAGLLGCSVGAVKVRVHRAMKELRHEYFQLAGGNIR